MKALLIIENQELRGLLHFYLEARFHLEIVEGRSFAEGITLLKDEANKVDFVVCDFERGGKELMSHVFKNSVPLHFITASSNPPDLSESKVLKNWVHFIRDNRWIDHLEKVLPELFPDLAPDHVKDAPSPNTSSPNTSSKEQQYSRIRTSYLLLVSPVPTDLFHKTDPDKFTPVMQKGAAFEAKHLKVFQVKNKVEYLYLKSSEALAFAKAFEVAISGPSRGALQGAKPGAPAQQDLGAAMETVQELAGRIGFTAEVQEFTKANVLKTINEVKKAPRLNALLSRLNRDREKYISNHSMLVAHLACALATEMEWRSDTTYAKLTMSAFLHDLPLGNHEELAQIQNLKELEAAGDKFTPELVNLYKSHPIMAAEFAKRFDEVPPDVDLILIQHHERPDGSGFPRGLTHTWISPLTAVFIVAHDLTRFILSRSADKPLDEEAIKEFLLQHRLDYNYSNFKAAVEGLKKIQIG